MSEAEMLHYGTLCAAVCKGIRNDDEDSVKLIMKQLTDDELVRVYAMVTNQLSHDGDIKNLEPSVVRAVRMRRMLIQRWYKELSSFRYRWKLLSKQPEGYPKYQAQMALVGRDPMSYHQWCETQVYFQVGMR